jgi:hypothetical protein
MNSSSRSAVLSLRLSAYCVIEMPATYSVTKYGTPSGVEPGPEAGDHFVGVHAAFDQLESNAAADGLLLLRQPDLAHTPFANFLQQAIAANHPSRGFTCVEGPSCHALFAVASDNVRVGVFFSRHVFETPFPGAQLHPRKYTPMPKTSPVSRKP